MVSRVKSCHNACRPTRCFPAHLLGILRTGGSVILSGVVIFAGLLRLLLHPARLGAGWNSTLALTALPFAALASTSKPRKGSSHAVPKEGSRTSPDECSTNAGECYRSIFEGSSIAVLLVDEQGRLVEANAMAGRLDGSVLEVEVTATTFIFPPLAWRGRCGKRSTKNNMAFSA